MYGRDSDNKETHEEQQGHERVLPKRCQTALAGAILVPS